MTRQRATPTARGAGIGMACLSLIACSSDQTPADATLRIEPGSRTTTVQERLDANGNCISIDDYYLDTPIVLSLVDGQGSPIGDVEVTVAVDWSGNTFSGTPALALYDDMNGNGVIDGEEELISAADDDLAIVKTDRYAGTRMLLLRTYLSCTFRGDVFAFSGAAAATMPIEVGSEQSEPDVEPETEPGDETEQDVDPDQEAES